MKKTIVALILASGVTAIAFAALDSSSASKTSGKKMKTEKKVESKKKKECKRTCMYSI